MGPNWAFALVAPDDDAERVVRGAVNSRSKGALRAECTVAIRVAVNRWRLLPAISVARSKESSRVYASFPVVRSMRSQALFPNSVLHLA